jgi:hypothetical protein
MIHQNLLLLRSSISEKNLKKKIHEIEETNEVLVALNKDLVRL